MIGVAAPEATIAGKMNYLNLLEFEQAAKSRMSTMGFDYYASGACDERTLARNQSAFDDLALAYRVLRDVSSRTCQTRLFNRALAMPILAAPTAFHQLAHPQAELATAQGVKEAGSLMILSTLSNVPVEQVAASGVPLWFQLYIYRDRGLTEALIRRVEACGCEALVWTVDAPLLGKRERDIRNRFQLPEGFSMANLLPSGNNHLPNAPTDSGLAAYFASLLDPAISWADLSWLRSITDLPIIVKGIVRADDAVRAIELGAAGIVVSNHGGRQLDSAPATIHVLPTIAEAVAGLDRSVPLLIDGGIRRGTDVIKALALGAQAVLLGRPILWGLAVDGASGVAAILNLLYQELDLAMALCGARTLDELDRDLILPA